MEISRTVQQSDWNFIKLGWTGLRQKELGACQFGWQIFQLEFGWSPIGIGG